MEVALLEDPGCSWCWAYQPVETAFLFEYGDHLRLRRVMGGLRDFPVGDVEFVLSHWKLAAKVSGMPFEIELWQRRILRTTFVACRAVKAAQMIRPSAASRYLRRLREAFYTERCPIDDLDGVLALAADVGLEADRLRDHLDSGRADALFQRDRDEAARNGFGFPTLVLRAANEEEPVLLQGVVPYSEVTRALEEMGFPSRRRRRFQDRPEDWARIFTLRPRITRPELELVTRLSGRALEEKLEEIGALADGPYWVHQEAVGPERPIAAAAAAALDS